jgi:ribonuclease HI
MPASSRPQVTIYTDGGADPNPGPGGWGAVLLHARAGAGGERIDVREISGHEPLTTNNRMELTAAIRALESLPQPSRVELFTDSAYLRKGVSEWLPGWIARGWRRQTGELQNEDLWRRLAPLAAAHEVIWRWVKGHAGHRWNERADQLATQAIRAQRAALAAAAHGGAGDPARPAEAAVPPAPPDAEVYLRVANPAGGRGGWAALLRRSGGEGPGPEEILSGAAAVPSANALDLVAAAAALERLPPGLVVAVYSGSDYLRNGACQWLAGWKRGGWKTREGAPVKNRELWQRLDSLLAARRILWPEIDAAAQSELDRLAAAARAAARGIAPA